MLVSKKNKNKLKAKKRKIPLDVKKEKLIFYLEKGLSIEDACILAKVSKKNLDGFCSEVDFEYKLKQYILSYELDQLDNISLHGKADWRASAWLLERKFPEKYGKKDIIKHEYEIKMMAFQNIVLEVINDTAPHLKSILVQKLREINLDDNKLLSLPKSLPEEYVLNDE